MSQELKYKVGDRVRVARSDLSTFSEVGVIDEIDLDPETQFAYLVDFGDKDDWFREAELTRAASSPDEQDIENAGGSDPVEHPAHYGGDTTYEVIKVIEAWGLGFALGNVTKYVARAGKKDPAKELEDLRKAAFYLQRRIDQLTQ